MLGILLSLVAAVFFGFSTTLQKRCVRCLSRFSIMGLCRDRNWLFSIMLSLAGILIYLAALRFEEISYVQPILSLSIVIPVLIGHILWKESIARKLFPIFLIIAGVVLLSL